MPKQDVPHFMRKYQVFFSGRGIEIQKYIVSTTDAKRKSSWINYKLRRYLCKTIQVAYRDAQTLTYLF